MTVPNPPDRAVRRDEINGQRRLALPSAGYESPLRNLGNGTPSFSHASKLALTVILLLASGCAKMGLPEGGPPDTTAPVILHTDPPAGAVSVPHSATITIEFSELVDRTTLTSDLTVSPPLAGSPEVKWSGRTVSLRWADTLRPEVTYRFSLGSKLSDLHTNRLKEPITIAFSTGARIDSCRIRGHVSMPEPASTSLSILAYQLDSSGKWPPDKADYISQTGSGGQFDLPYLPPAVYRLLAVGDKNRNGRPDQNELFALGNTDVDLRTRIVAEGIRLFASSLDTTVFRLDGCSQTADGSLLVGLTHAADTAHWAGARFIVVDSATRESLTVSVLRPVPPKLTTLPILCDKFVAGHTYEVMTGAGETGATVGIRDRAGFALSRDSCRVFWGTTVDTVGPRVSWTQLPIAENAITAASPFQIGFNEPVDTIASHDVLLVKDSLGHDLAGSRRWLDPRHLVFTPSPSWPDSVVVVVASLDTNRLFDRRGHLVGLQPHLWKFRPLLRSQIGALAGTIELPDSAWTMVPCHLEAHPIGKGPVITQALARPGPFELNLPAGRWILGAFLDLNRDGCWSSGQIKPYEPAEPRMIQPDTVTVRARFTLDGVVIRF